MSFYPKRNNITALAVSLVVLGCLGAVVLLVYYVFFVKKYDNVRYTFANGDRLTIQKRSEFSDPDEELVSMRFIFNGRLMHHEIGSGAEVTLLNPSASKDDVNYICDIGQHAIYVINDDVYDFSRGSNRFLYIATIEFSEIAPFESRDPADVALKLCRAHWILNTRYVEFLLKQHDPRAISDVIANANGHFTPKILASMKEQYISRVNAKRFAQRLVAKYKLGPQTSEKK